MGMAVTKTIFINSCSPFQGDSTYNLALICKAVSEKMLKIMVINMCNYIISEKGQTRPRVKMFSKTQIICQFGPLLRGVLFNKLHCNSFPHSTNQAHVWLTLTLL